MSNSPASNSPASNSPMRASSCVWADVGGTSSPQGELQDRAFTAVVVGAGIVGLTTALLLAEAGVPCAVLEARAPGAGTTGRSTAKASLLQGTRGSRILREHGMETFLAYVEANRCGQDLLTRLADTDTTQVRDAWTYATNDEDAARVWEEAEALSAIGVPASVEPAEELPFPTRAAVRLSGQLQLDPAAHLRGLLSMVRQHGVPVLWPARVHRVDRAGGASLDLVARSSGGDDVRVHADWVVLASLLPFPLRTATFAATTPAMSYALAGVPSSTPIPRGMYLSAGPPTRSLRTATAQDGRELLMVGGEGHPTGRDGSASSHLAELARWADVTFGLGVVEHQWAAQDYTSADGLPHIGRAPFGPSQLLLATGFGKWGMTNGTAAAHVLAQIIGGTPPDWAAAFAPRIASGMTGWRQVVAANVQVGAGLADGWARDPEGQLEPGEGQGVVQRTLPTPTAVSLVSGRRRACSAVCTHLGGVVRWNDLARTWDCPLHGSRFLPDGEVVEGPATDALAHRDPLP